MVREDISDTYATYIEYDKDECNIKYELETKTKQVRRR